MNYCLPEQKDKKDAGAYAAGVTSHLISKAIQQEADSVLSKELYLTKKWYNSLETEKQQ